MSRPADWMQLFWNADETVLRFQIKGTLDFLNAREVKLRIMDELMEDVYLLQMDLGQLEHLDSTGIAALAYLNRKMQARGHSFRIVGTPFHVLQIFRMASLEHIFDYHRV